ncbi:DUF6270 domain-containing protein [Mesorhizobium sp. ES1-1]|uniref:DUF6270 domain-containing protein n=1 Tax=Mesorhizobium sp. ES1-1 TaxID=2876629 RepID=UPI001CCFCB1C|nr:DUF6270 domain-containing protein [Mesorhizobium sp. ES1-1]MBZ9674406.1 DUF6270 domain-containing protein [Mesorhizobium sp. ES1-1]
MALVPPTCHFYTRALLLTDFDNTALEQMAAARPDTLVLNFKDERFDLLAQEDVLVTESLELIESGMISDTAIRGARGIPRLWIEAWSLWMAGLLRLRIAFDDGRRNATATR